MYTRRNMHSRRETRRGLVHEEVEDHLSPILYATPLPTLKNVDLEKTNPEVKKNLAGL